MEGAKAAAHNADIQYQDAVKILEEARVLWEREMDILCNKFQECEEQRIAFLRHQMWTLCNYCSQTTVEDDEVGRVLRVHVNSSLTKFINITSDRYRYT